MNEANFDVLHTNLGSLGSLPVSIHIALSQSIIISHFNTLLHIALN
jgi:hypothetical protein